MISFNQASFIKKLDVVIDAATFQLIATTPYLMVQTQKIFVPISCIAILSDQTIEFDFADIVFLKTTSDDRSIASRDPGNANILNGSFNFELSDRPNVYSTGGDVYLTTVSDATQGDGNVRIVLTYFEINP